MSLPRVPMSMPELSILVPCRNESASILNCLQRLVLHCPQAEILVIDGGSDTTGTLVQEFQLSASNVQYLPNPQDRGKGHAIRVGIAAARGQYIAQIDADLQFLPEEVENLLVPLRADRADMVLGSRFCRHARRQPGSAAWHRSIGNYCFSALTSLLAGQRLTDGLAGFKAWRREVTESFLLSSDSYSYELELPIKARRAGWRVTEVPVTYEPRRAGVSTVNVVPVAWRLLCDSFRVRFEAMELS